VPARGSKLARDTRANLKKAPRKGEYERAQRPPPGKAKEGPKPGRATPQRSLVKTLTKSVERAKKKRAASKG
jgi:hypothetical protein